MGTRNLTCVVLDKKIKIAQYGQWDGYPKGQGKTIVQFITKKLNKPLFIKKLKEIRVLTDKELNELWKSFGADGSGMVSMGTADKLKNQYPHLSRDCGAEVLELIKSGKAKEIHNNLEFARDSLFCEWCYVIDLDKNVLEVYEGFNNTPLTEKDRFYTKEKPFRSKGLDGISDTYYPVKLIKKFPFKGLTVKKFLDYFEKYDKESEDKND